MADTKLTGLTATTTPVLTDYGYIVTTPGGTPASHYVTLDVLQQILSVKNVADGRLTLTSGTPVTTANVTAATTLYYTFYKGNKIGLYDGTSWHVRTFAELSITLASLTAGRPYDVWIYDNSGTPALELLTWSSTSARGTALAYQDGVLVKSGAATRRYVGTICITGTTGQCEDSLTKRLVWNYYNRCARRLYKTDANAHAYTTGAYQAWNADATVRVELVLGVLEDVLNFGLVAEALCTGAVGAYVNLGEDSTTTAFDSLSNYGTTINAAVNRSGVALSRYPAVGYHYYQIIEFGDTGGNFHETALNGTLWG